jgi:membrane protein required for colicin V production
MNWLDALLALILATSVITSFRKGFSRELIGLVSVLLALLLGIWFYGTAGSFLLPYLSSRRMAMFAGFVLVFLGVLVLGGIVSFLTGRFLKVTGLSFFDHLLGAGFGLVRGTLIGVALVLGIMAFSAEGKPPQSVVNSRLAPYVVDGARLFAAVAPHEVKDGFRKTYAQVRAAWEHTLDKKLQAPKAEKEADGKRI